MRSEIYLLCGVDEGYSYVIEAHNTHEGAKRALLKRFHGELLYSNEYDRYYTEDAPFDSYFEIIRQKVLD